MLDRAAHALVRSAAQVSELESLFEGLRGDVDALFMQTPSVDQEGLCRQSEEMHHHLEEQARSRRRDVSTSCGS